MPGLAPRPKVSDLNCRLSALFAHPVKSCGAVAVNEALVIETGLEFDRCWMVVDAQGEMLTQREYPRMALVQPQFGLNDLKLRAPGMLALHLALDRVEAPTRVRVWHDIVKAFDMGDLAAQWFSDFLGLPGLRLVRFDPEAERLSDRAWTGEVAAPCAFADGFALLVLSTASLAEMNRRLQAAGQAPVGMERFRPNIVLDGLDAAHAEDALDTLSIESPDGPIVLKLVKPCSRCNIPNIDPTTAISQPSVNDALAQYRADPRLGGALTFGMNAIVISGIEHRLRVGAAVSARYAF